MTTCVRSAWLTLGSSSVQLEDPTHGYFCTQLNVGYPTVREVKANRPDTHGIDDRTLFWGERVVTADVTALAGAGARIDTVAGLFAPFMDIDARPTLHWILDRPGAPERVLVVRAAGFSTTISGDNRRDIHLQWVAADPTIRDPVTQTVSAWAGSGTAPGRTYNLTYPRTYPAGGTGATTGYIRTYGDLPIQPLFTIYGPVTTPAVYLHNNSDPSTVYAVRFDAGYQIPAAHYVTVDTGRKTVYVDGDPNQPVMDAVDWLHSTWPYVPPYPNVGVVTMGGTSTSSVTQTVVSWQDAYLT
jgi:hypothetical protein